jgi:hypothetical protein
MLIVRKHTRLGLPPNPDHDVTPGVPPLEEPTPLGTAQPNSSPAAAAAPATADIVPITPPNPAPPAPATILPPTV